MSHHPVDLNWPTALVLGFVGGIGLLALSVSLGVLAAWLF
jgi:hypothetical protein